MRPSGTHGREKGREQRGREGESAPERRAPGEHSCPSPRAGCREPPSHLRELPLHQGEKGPEEEEGELSTSTQVPAACSRH